MRPVDFKSSGAMSDSTFLEGKVRRVSLRSFPGAPGSDAPVLKRLLLPQGELAQFYDADEPLRYLAYIALREGTARGNHYHEVKEEGIYLIQGDVELVVEDIGSKARASVPMAAGDLVFIPKRVAHTLRVLQSGHAIEFSEARFDPKDTYRYPLV